MISTGRADRLIRAGAAVFWIAVWEIASLLIGEELFLPSPVSVIRTLLSSVTEPVFWSSIAFTLSRILIGFLVSLACASVAAVLSYRFTFFAVLIDPLVRVIRATPVASIVILVLVWVRSRDLSVVISFMMVFPIIYTNLLEGLRAMDRDLLEAADVYRVRRMKRIRYFYLPSLSPYIGSALSSSLGLAWKSGIAAEVIGLPDGSIGERVYEAKIFLSTPDLFAWTLVIIILAYLFERFFLALSAWIMERSTS